MHHITENYLIDSRNLAVTLCMRDLVGLEEHLDAARERAEYGFNCFS